MVLLVWNERLGKAHQRNERRWDEQLEQGATPQTSSFQRVILSQEGFELFSLPVLRRHHHRVLASKRVRGQMIPEGQECSKFEVRETNTCQKMKSKGEKSWTKLSAQSTVQGEQKKVW